MATSTPTSTVSPYRQLLARVSSLGGREVLLCLMLAAAAFVALSLWTYHRGDPGWSVRNGAEIIANGGGVIGAWLADLLLQLVGHVAWLFPVLIVMLAVRSYREREAPPPPDRFAWLARAGGFLLVLATMCGIATLRYGAAGTLPDGVEAGGIIGDIVGPGLLAGLGFHGAMVVLLFLWPAGWALLTRMSWWTVLEAAGRAVLFAAVAAARLPRRVREQQEVSSARRTRAQEVQTRVRRKPKPAAKARIEPVLTDIQPSARVARERQKEMFPSERTKLPELAHLDAPGSRPRAVSEAALETMARQVEIKLRDFGVEVEVVEVHPGPVITRFELQPSPGLKVSRVTALAKDLARSLSTVSVRIVEVIPGKDVIGLEVPNQEVELVYLSEILSSADYEKNASPVALGLGKDIAGQPVVVDLARMPHLLVAGTTGSGKSVALNAMILSILYKATPDEVRLIMVDPKMLELSVYEGIPHLLAPVVTDMKDASNAFRWCIGEMERRYRLMSTIGVRNIAGYNRAVAKAVKEGKPLRNPLAAAAATAGAPGEAEGAGAPGPDEFLTESLPLIVVVVDELADLMMVTGKKIEQLIARLAQKARASGIHLLLATQRPSVDVITGLIKANIPSRIAFQVSSRIDSRTILDQGGAEQLLGHGDMLHMTPGLQTPVRVHGAFVSDDEVHRVVENMRVEGDAHYVDDVLEGGGDFLGGGRGGDGENGGADAESDPLYDEAVRLVTESGRASISGVQRRLKIGYNRAARMIEQMEETGVVGPLQANGSREVLAPPPPSD